MPFSMIERARWAYSIGRPRRRGNGMLAASAWRAGSGRPASSGVSNRPGRDRDHADAERGQVARDRQRHADHRRLRRGVGDLSDLTVVGRRPRRCSRSRRARRRASVAFLLMRSASKRIALKVPTTFTSSTFMNGSSGCGPSLVTRALRPADARAVHRRCGCRRTRRRRGRPRPPPGRPWSRRRDRRSCRGRARRRPSRRASAAGRGSRRARRRRRARAPSRRRVRRRRR